MGNDRHLGRNTPVFNIEGDPQKYNGLIERHGTLARVMRARKCPCIKSSGSPDLYCKLCKGDGFIHEFQRKFLAFEEDADIRSDREVVYPFMVPILEPISVERMLAPEAGGIVKYTINSFDSNTITIAGSPLPYHYNQMRVSHYFDGYTFASQDVVDVNDITYTLTTTQTRYDGEYRNSNVTNVHGDIALVTEVKNIVTGYIYKDYTFRKNVIQIGSREPKPVQGQIVVSYHFVEPTLVLPQSLDTTNEKDNWNTDMTAGRVMIGMKYWYEISEGDLITLLAVELYKDVIITHNASTGVDKLNEFDIVRLDDEIIDEDGIHYINNVDFVLKPFRDIAWMGKQPKQGKKFSVRFSYRPTYIVFLNNPTPNALENKKYPTLVNAKYYQMMLPKDIEHKSNPEYTPDSSDPKVSGFTDL